MARAVQAQQQLGIAASVHPADRPELNRVLDAAGGDTYIGIWFSEDYTKTTVKIHNADTHQVVEEHVFRAGVDAELYERQARIQDSTM